MLIAGPVFEGEWYWEIFFALYFIGVPLVLVVALVDAVASWRARRAGRWRSKGERAGVGAAVVAVVGGLWWWSGG